MIIGNVSGLLSPDCSGSCETDLFIFTVRNQGEVDFVKENSPSKTISEILTDKRDNTYSIGCCYMIWILFHCLELQCK